MQAISWEHDRLKLLDQTVLPLKKFTSPAQPISKLPTPFVT